MRAHALSLLVSLAVLAGCQGQATAPSPGLASTSGAKPAASAKPVAAAPKLRSQAVRVVAPIELAVGGGKILTDGGAGLIRGGQILTDGGAGLVAKFALRGAFTLQAATDKFAVVQAAGVQALGLDGQPIGAVGSTDAEGGVTLADLPADKTISVIAAFKANGKVYRLAASLGADDLGGTLQVDPINTMVEARVRDILGAQGGSALVTNDRLKRVWTICNKADITLAPAELEAGRSVAELTASLNKAWTAAIDAKVTTASEKAEIQSFMADLAALK